MLLTQATLQGITDGTVTVAFRRWRKLRVRTGSSFRTAVGVVVVTSVEVTSFDHITAQDGLDAGYESREALIADLSRHREGELYRIGLRFEGADPRVALRARHALDPRERESLVRQVLQFGRKGDGGPWGERTLELIESHPGTRAAVLAGMMGMETLRFKARVRQLKELGLTESLEIGYRLSPRGESLLKALKIRDVETP